jgi:hypothetical protein
MRNVGDYFIGWRKVFGYWLWKKLGMPGLREFVNKKPIPRHKAFVWRLLVRG